MTGSSRRTNRAGRPGRPESTSRRRAGQPPEPRATLPAGPSPLLGAHVGLIAALVVSTLVLLLQPSSEYALVGIVVGLLAFAELVALLVALAVAGTTGHHSPLVVVDTIVAVPLVVFVLSGVADGGGPQVAVAFIAVVLLAFAIASALLAARVVRPRPTERIVLAFALVPVLAFASAYPIAMLVPIAVLAVLFAPDPGWRPARRRLEQQRSRRPSIPVATRRGAPDAAAVLARRAPDPSERAPDDRS